MLKIPATNCMLDIETTSLDPSTGMITSYGAVFFGADLLPFATTGHALNYLKLERWNFKDDLRTMNFRAEHGIEAMEDEMCRCRPAEFITHLHNLFNEHQDCFVWSKPTKFDLPFLERLINLCGFENPWFHRNIIDMRSFLMGMGYTLDDISKIERNEVEFVGKLHNPIDDAMHQVRVLKYCYDNA